MLVRIVKDWDKPDIMRQTPGFSKNWKGITFTTDNVDSCDLLVALNRTKCDLKIRTREAWLFSQESPIDLYKWHTKAFSDFDRVFTFWDSSISANIINTQTALPWHIGKNYDELKNISIESCKNKADEISWVTSSASDKEGHRLRLKFLDYLRNVGFKFSLYGKGFNPIADKYDVIFPFKYSIAIENYSCADYWTEKIADCYLSWSAPIYFGATNILEYFPNNSLILIDPNEPKKALDTINRAREESFWEKNISEIEIARNLILEKYQFFPWICKLISDYNLSEKRYKKMFIKKNITLEESKNSPDIKTRLINKIKKIVNLKKEN